MITEQLQFTLPVTAAVDYSPLAALEDKAASEMTEADWCAWDELIAQYRAEHFTRLADVCRIGEWAKEGRI